MNIQDIRKMLARIRPPFNFHTSDGRVIYVDHPESVFLTRQTLAIVQGTDPLSGIAEDFELVSTDHVVRIARTHRKPMRWLKK